MQGFYEEILPVKQLEIDARSNKNGQKNESLWVNNFFSILCRTTILNGFPGYNVHYVYAKLFCVLMNSSWIITPSIRQFMALLGQALPTKGQNYPSWNSEIFNNKSASLSLGFYEEKIVVS